MKMRQKDGFTLVELIMVVAIIALIATLAVSKLSGFRLNSEKKLSLANQTRIASGVEAFLAAGNRLNRLDSLVDWETANSAGGSTGKVTNVNSHFINGNGVQGENRGLDGDLRRQLCEYTLTASDVQALRDDLGLQITYAAKTQNTSAYFGQDGTMGVGVAGDPKMCSCMTVSNDAGRVCAMINPMPVGYTGGYLVYQACGQDVQYVSGAGRNGALMINGDEDTRYTTLEDAFAKLNAKKGGGILLAFGLGDGASIVGNNNAGLETAPICPIVDGDIYPRYILLIRLKTVGQQAVSERVAEFAGVIDAKGQPSLMAEWYVEGK